MNFLAHKFFSRFFIIVAVAFTLATTANALPNKLGDDYEFTRISGNSMLPTLTSGETAVVYKAYPFKKLRVGDVVIIQSERGYSVIHRIVRRYRGGMWVTKGDNNSHEDREVLSQNNFRGLALVDDSINRYKKYVASLGEQPEAVEQVAMADNSDTDNRLNRLRKL